MGNLNPPVCQIYLVGPKEEGMLFARNLYPICLERKWLPAFFVTNRLGKDIIKCSDSKLLRTGVITFGPESEKIYRRLYGINGGMKVLRLLDAGVPEPKPFFSYQAQIFSYPQDSHDYDLIASWMGITPYGDWPDFRAVFPDALTEEKLVKKEVNL